MPKFVGNQLSLITDFDVEDFPVGDYHFDELGSEKSNCEVLVLRTRLEDLPRSPLASLELGSKIELDPNPIDRLLPLGWLEQKPIKNGLYWYWRYYKNSGARASIYCGKDYTKAVRKVLETGYPIDAKPIPIPQSDSNPQKVLNQAENPLYRFPAPDSSSFAA